MNKKDKEMLESLNIDFLKCKQCGSNEMKAIYKEPSKAKQFIGYMVGGLIGSLLALRRTGIFIQCKNCGEIFDIKDLENKE